MTWTKGLNAPSARLLVIPNWGQWLIQLQALLPFSGTLTGWRVGQRETLQGSTTASAGFCVWGGITPRTSTGWGLISLKFLMFQKYFSSNLFLSEMCHNGQHRSFLSISDLAVLKNFHKSKHSKPWKYSVKNTQNRKSFLAYKRKIGYNIETKGYCPLFSCSFYYKKHQNKTRWKNANLKWSYNLDGICKAFVLYSRLPSCISLGLIIAWFHLWA